MAKCLLRGTWAVLLSHSPGQSEPILQGRPLTGEPDAGKPPVRFGGRGEVQSPAPTPIKRGVLQAACFTRRGWSQRILTPNELDRTRSDYLRLAVRGWELQHSLVFPH